VQAILYPLALIVYNIYVNPLRKFPGPKLAAATTLPKIWYMSRGETLGWINCLHREYGSIVRVGPNELSFLDAQAWKDIYGFQPAGKTSNHKDPKFYDFASLAVRSLVNANDQDHARARRIFSNAFSDKALKEQEPLFMKYADLMVQKLHEMVDLDLDTKVNIVEMFNFTTFDIMGMSVSLLLATYNLLAEIRRSHLRRALIHASKLKIRTLGCYNLRQCQGSNYASSYITLARSVRSSKSPLGPLYQPYA
jgi:hypothetical protein